MWKPMWFSRLTMELLKFPPCTSQIGIFVTALQHAPNRESHMLVWLFLKEQVANEANFRGWKKVIV